MPFGVGGWAEFKTNDRLQSEPLGPAREVPMAAQARRGLTLVELLVVVAIIGILMALLLPAVQQSRENARATQCRNNLHQIGIGLHSYYAAHNSFPPGCVGTVDDPVNLQGWGWGTFLLPYVDQGHCSNRCAPLRTRCLRRSPTPNCNLICGRQCRCFAAHRIRATNCKTITAL